MNQRATEAELQHAFEEELRRNDRLSVLLFDLDGTLVDTMGLHFAAYSTVLQRRGGVLDRLAFDQRVGPPARVTIPLFAEAAGLSRPSSSEISSIHQEKKAVLEEILSEARLESLPAVSLLQRAAGRFSIGVVTSGNRRGATAILTAAGIFADVEQIVTSDDVSIGKPHPEPFLVALDRFRIKPFQGLVFEDHPDGIQAAVASGLTVIDVRDATVIR